MLENIFTLNNFIEMNFPAYVPPPHLHGEFLDIVPLQGHFVHNIPIPPPLPVAGHPGPVAPVFPAQNGIYSSMRVGAGAETFNWLPYVPGAITATQLNNDVLSGPFSGCWMAKYQNAAGVIRIGHIGTNGENEAHTKAVKGVWNGIAAGNPDRIFGGIKSTSFMDLAPYPRPTAPDMPGPPQVFCFHTVAGQWYIVYLMRRQHSYLRRVAGLHQVYSQPLQQVRSI